MENVKFEKGNLELVKLEEKQTEKKDGGITKKYIATFEAGDSKVVITSPKPIEGLVVGMDFYHAAIKNLQDTLD